MGIIILKKKKMTNQKRYARNTQNSIRRIQALLTLKNRTKLSKFDNELLKCISANRASSKSIGISTVKSLLKMTNKKFIIVVSTLTNCNSNTAGSLNHIHLCVIRFTEGANSRILEEGGKISSFEELGKSSHNFRGCLLIKP